MKEAAANEQRRTINDALNFFPFKQDLS